MGEISIVEPKIVDGSTELAVAVVVGTLELAAAVAEKQLGVVGAVLEEEGSLQHWQWKVSLKLLVWEKNFELVELEVSGLMIARVNQKSLAIQRDSFALVAFLVALS